MIDFKLYSNIGGLQAQHKSLHVKILVDIFLSETLTQTPFIYHFFYKSQNIINIMFWLVSYPSKTAGWHSADYGTTEIAYWDHTYSIC